HTDDAAPGDRTDRIRRGPSTRAAKKNSSAEEFLVLLLLQLVNLLDVPVGDLLNLVETLALVVFRDLVVLEELLQPFVGVAPDLAHAVPALLAQLVDMSGQLLPALVGQSRDGNAHELPVVRRVQPQVRGADRPLDSGEQ